MERKKELDNTLKSFIELFVIAALILLPFLIFRDNMYIITSGSMEPELNVGDLVITYDKDPDDIKADEEDGDIIVMKAKYFYEQGYDEEFWGGLDLSLILWLFHAIQILLILIALKSLV